MLFLRWSFVVALASAQCPDWILSWGTYTGSLDDNNVCVYANIRFASPPIGQLRFAAPEYPPGNDLPPLPGPNPVCPQMNETQCLASGPLLGGDGSCFGPYYGTQSEDCLFLDVYVPASVFSNEEKVPVIAWFFGGAYLFGSKTAYDPTKLPFYSGDGMLNTATENNEDNAVQNAIFVAGNYRLGAFGWLAGCYMEQNAQPNAGLLDQRMILQFIHDHIADVYGDADNVSVWGESAGASSIMHHLTMPLNVETPLFKRAILQSPAYQWLYDRRGTLNATFNDFAGKVSKLQGCKNADISCLRNANTSVLQSVNQGLFQEAACKGILPVGPAVDGNLVPALASYRFFAQENNTIVNLDTIAISHVDLEVPYSASTDDWSFIPLPVRKNPQSESAFQNMLAAIFPGNKTTSIRAAISSKYNLSLYSDQVARAAAVIADSSFLCNTRLIIEEYLNQSRPVYAMDYAVLMNYDILGFNIVLNASTHASDLLPAFSNQDTDYTDILKCLKPNLSDFLAGKASNEITSDTSPGMQQYFTDHAIWGDPNKNDPGTSWKQAAIGQCPDPNTQSTCVQHMLKPETAFVESVWDNNDATDTQTSSDICLFWGKVSREINNLSLSCKNNAEQSVGEKKSAGYISSIIRWFFGKETQTVLDDYDL